MNWNVIPVTDRTVSVTMFSDVVKLVRGIKSSGVVNFVITPSCPVTSLVLSK